MDRVLRDESTSHRLGAKSQSGNNHIFSLCSQHFRYHVVHILVGFAQTAAVVRFLSVYIISSFFSKSCSWLCLQICTHAPILHSGQCPRLFSQRNLSNCAFIYHLQLGVCPCSLQQLLDTRGLPMVSFMVFLMPQGGI